MVIGALAAAVLIIFATSVAAHTDSAVSSSTQASARERMQSEGGMLRLPTVGLGLWKSSPGEARGAVKTALRCGYRLLDGAAAYGNEKEVGAAVADALAEGVVRREEIVVVSKLFNTHHVWDESERHRPRQALLKTLADLQLSSVDLYLMHWPWAIEQIDLAALGGLRLADGTPNPALKMRMEFLDTWREMIALQQEGLCKEIGVSNFTIEQLQQLLEAFPHHKPRVNQCELHPYLAQPELTAFCRQHDIALMAYSPLGSGDSYSGASYPARGSGPFECSRGGAPLLRNEVVGEIAARRGVTAAQVLLRWGVEQGFCVLPKSVNAERIAANLYSVSPDWSLDEADKAALAELDCGFRYGIGYGPGHYDSPNAPWYRQKAE